MADATPVRPASTVMLLRDGSAGLEVFTLRRVAGMAFAGGMTAFPGGGVEIADADPSVPWTGPDADWWAAQWRIGAETARAHVVAAVRELFEETGILLAGQDRDVSSGEDPDRETDRLAVTAHRRSLADMLRRMGSPLRADLLRPWARWITPPGQTRRYDTYFFVAALPDGQQPAAVTTEASSVQWERPAEVLRAEQDGAVSLMPPTVAMLMDLAGAASVSEVLETPRVVEPVTPVVLTADGEVLRVRAGDREYSTRLPRR